MRNKFIQGILALLIGALCLVFLYTRSTDNTPPQEQPVDVTALRDSIEGLHTLIDKYYSQIESMQEERVTIKKEIIYVEKIKRIKDSAIINSGLDANVAFLTEYLSKKDSSQH